LYLYTKVAAREAAVDVRQAAVRAYDETKAAYDETKAAYDETKAAHDKTKAALALTQCTFALCDDGCCGWRCRDGHGQCEEHTKDSVEQFMSDGSNQYNYICDVTGTRCQEHITAEEASKSMSR
jgi:hypothetical protein